jgi:hypothetical protein
MEPGDALNAASLDRCDWAEIPGLGALCTWYLSEPVSSFHSQVFDIHLSIANGESRGAYQGSFTD